jgi:tRNA threonylcarbamoyladenosine biosynthesis protein TsaE
VETLTGPAVARATTVTTRSEDETRAFAAALAAVARAGDRLALVGPLGAGKTQFAKGFASGLGVHEVVNSPSFTLMAEYAGRLPLFHQDLYRLAGADEILAGGLLDERQSEGVTLSEWAERLPAALDPDRLTVRIDIAGENERRISVEPGLPDQVRYATAAGAWRP